MIYKLKINIKLIYTLATILVVTKGVHTIKIHYLIAFYLLLIKTNFFNIKINMIKFTYTFRDDTYVSSLNV